jgi:hypothetical protein
MPNLFLSGNGIIIVVNVLTITARRLVAVFGAEPTEGRGHYFY